MPPGARHLGATIGLRMGCGIPRGLGLCGGVAGILREHGRGANPRGEFNGLGWAREWHTEGKGRKGPSEGACHEQKPVSQKNLKKKKRIKQVAGD